MRLKRSEPGPAIRLRRSANGVEFSAEFIDEKGRADFLTEELISDYDKALAKAKARAHGHRIPFRDETGVEKPKRVEAQPPPAPPKVAKPVKTISKSPQTKASTPTISSQFQLPDVSARLGKIDTVPLVERAFAEAQETRNAFVQKYDEARDRICSYSQKTHDQVQYQITDVHIDLVLTVARTYAFLEAAFARIAELEAGASPSPEAIAESFRGMAETIVSEALTKSMSARKTSRTVVTKHDPAGRIAEFMRYDMAGEADPRFAELEQRLAKAEQGRMAYRGVWEDRTYNKGSVVTFGGSMWHANKRTATKPGDDHDAWTLCCKRGRDGKDIRP